MLIDLGPFSSHHFLLISFESSEFSRRVFFVLVDVRDELFSRLLIDHSDCFIGFLLFTFDDGNLLVRLYDLLDLGLLHFFFKFIFLDVFKSDCFNFALLLGAEGGLLSIDGFWLG